MHDHDDTCEDCGRPICPIIAAVDGITGQVTIMIGPTDAETLPAVAEIIQSERFLDAINTEVAAVRLRRKAQEN